MRVIHVSAHCHVASAVGTERYQYDLIRELRSAGVESALCWLRSPDQDVVHDAAGVEVITLPAASPDAWPAPSLGGCATRLLDERAPDLLHFHSFGHREAAIARTAVARGIPYVFTYHYPGATCPSRSLLEWGREPCDGELRPLRCGTCRVASLARLPKPPGPRLPYLLEIGAWSMRRGGTLAGAPGLQALRDSLRWFLGHAGRVFVASPRSSAVLARNGASDASLSICVPGVATDFTVGDDLAAARGNGTSVTRAHDASLPAAGRGVPASCVVGYLGRVDPLKGVGTLVEAFLQTRAPEARLRIAGGPGADSRARVFARRIRRTTARDPRVELVEEQPIGTRAALYADLSAVAIPSIGVETGPLVLFEALRLGIPVLASEQIAHPQLLGAHDRIVRPNTVASWRSALEELFARVKSGAAQGDADRALTATSIRTMADVARDVLDGYRRLAGAAA